MKVVKGIGIVILVYLGIVVAFESMIGILQPDAGTTLVITTASESGEPNDRVLARLETDGQIYVAANHWPRAWYRQALANPNVQAAFDGHKRGYLAVPIPVGSDEHARVQREHDSGIGFRILTGFPPRYFLRLDPRTDAGA